MKIKDLPYCTFTILNNFREFENSKVKVYPNDSFSRELIKQGYLIFDKDSEEDITPYKFYRISNKLLNLTDKEILEDLTGVGFKHIMSEKVISISKIPLTYKQALNALNDGDGFINLINTDAYELGNILEFHGFVEQTGINGITYDGTDKLANFIKDKGYYSIIEVITGKTRNENEKSINKKNKDIAIEKMMYIADLYGYSVSKN